jgi:hypothetical protein
VFLTDGYIAKEIMDSRTEMVAKEVAKSGSTLPELRNGLYARHRMAWLNNQACHVSAWLGRLLVAMGRRLERYGQGRVPQTKGSSTAVNSCS